MSEGRRLMSIDDGCICREVANPWTYYGIAEPGGAMEPNPDCEVHFPKVPAEVLEKHFELEWSFEHGGFVCAECGWQETYARPYAKDAQKGARANHLSSVLAATILYPSKELLEQKPGGNRMRDCTCTPHEQNAGGVYVEYTLEPNPDCPEHFPNRVRPSMAVILAAHPKTVTDVSGLVYCANLTCRVRLGTAMELTGSRLESALAAHQAEVLAANGYGKLEDAWDEGYTTGNAHNGRRDANPYRRPE